MKHLSKIILAGVGLIITTGIVFAENSEYLQGKLLPAYNPSKCYDSDKGQNYKEKGVAYGTMSNSSKTQFSDYCNGNNLTEYYCARNRVQKSDYSCEGVCDNGACLEAYKWEDAGSAQDYAVKVGDKIAVSSQLNIRIESIADLIVQGQHDMIVQYSIWGKDNNNKCQFVSNTGWLGLNTPGYKFREFTDAFIELINAQGETATIRKYTGTKARIRCEAIADDQKKPIACSFYPGGEDYFINSENFKFHFHHLEDLDKAKYTTHALENCFSKMKEIIQGVQNVTPFKSKWGLYTQIGESPGVASTDYERIVFPYFIVGITQPTDFDESYKQQIDAGKCPAPGFRYIQHELTHLIFSGTPLQPVYDYGAVNILPSEISANPGNLDEGQAKFMEFFLIKDQLSDVPYNIFYSQFCGKDSLIASYWPEATPEQLKYFNALTGHGYGSNHYNAGFCFFDRVEKDCGESAIKYIFQKVVEEKGDIEARDTIFTQLSNVCAMNKVKEIMKDYGFDESLLTLKHTYPKGKFLSGNDNLGCIEGN